MPRQRRAARTFRAKNRLKPGEAGKMMMIFDFADFPSWKIEAFRKDMLAHWNNGAELFERLMRKREYVRNAVATRGITPMMASQECDTAEIRVNAAQR